MKEAIIIFTRVPIPGETKTRLEGFLSQNECRDLHISFLKDIEDTLAKAKRKVFIFYTPEKNREKLVEVLGNIGEYRVQVGNDLGEKMNNAISYVLKKGYNSCILIGTDIPEIREEYIETAFEALKEKDIVIGATRDNGYYLIGMKNPHRSIFENQTYGKGNVFLNTLKQIQKQNLTYFVTKTCLDIDDKEDILSLYERIQNEEVENCENTKKFLKSIMEAKLW